MHQELKIEQDPQGNALDIEFLKEWRVETDKQKEFNPAQLFEAKDIDLRLQEFSICSLSLGLPIENVAQASMLHNLLLESFPQIRHCTKRRQKMAICYVLASIAFKLKLFQVEEEILQQLRLDEIQWWRYRRETSLMIMDHPHLSTLWPIPKPSLQWWCLKFCQRFNIAQEIIDIVVNVCRQFEDLELFSNHLDRTRASAVILVVIRSSYHYRKQISCSQIACFFNKTHTTITNLFSHEEIQTVKTILRPYVRILKTVFL